VYARKLTEDIIYDYSCSWQKQLFQHFGNKR